MWPAALMNILPGFGHIYLGNWKRGVATFVACLLLGVMFVPCVLWLAVRSSTSPVLCITTFIFALIAALVWDGYRAATGTG